MKQKLRQALLKQDMREIPETVLRIYAILFNFASEKDSEHYVERIKNGDDIELLLEELEDKYYDETFNNLP